MNPVISNFLMLAVCAIASFLNYYLLQVGLPIVIPITVLPMSAFFLFGNRMSALSVIGIGVLDDVMTNTPYGMFLTFIYSVVAYVLSMKPQRKNKPTMILYVICVIYIAVNLLFLAC